MGIYEGIMNYFFEWNPEKAQLNYYKHGVRFERAASIFLDPRALTIFDDEHSEKEDRWMTMGMDTTGSILIAHHLFKDETKDSVRIRMFFCTESNN
jgi:hypothetical protein